MLCCVVVLCCGVKHKIPELKQIVCYVFSFTFFIACSSLSKDCPEKCEIFYDPLCASNGRTYKNRCNMERDNCFAKTEIVELYKGECLKSEEDEIEEDKK